MWDSQNTEFVFTCAVIASISHIRVSLSEVGLVQDGKQLYSPVETYMSVL